MYDVPVKMRSYLGGLECFNLSLSPRRTEQSFSKMGPNDKFWRNFLSSYSSVHARLVECRPKHFSITAWICITFSKYLSRLQSLEIIFSRSFSTRPETSWFCIKFKFLIYRHNSSYQPTIYQQNLCVNFIMLHVPSYPLQLRSNSTPELGGWFLGRLGIQ